MGHCLLCAASREAHRDRVFHTFPEEPSRRRLWLLYCGRDAEPEPPRALLLCATCCSPKLLNTAGAGGPPPPLHGSVEPGAGVLYPREPPPLVPLFANHPAGEGPAPDLAADRAEAVLAPWDLPAPLVSVIECSDTVSTEPLEVKPKVETMLHHEYLAGDPVNSASSPALPTGAEAPEHPVVGSSGAASGQEASGARIRCKPLEQLVSHSPPTEMALEAAWRAHAPLPPPAFYPTSVPAQEFNHLSAMENLTYGYRAEVPLQGPGPSADARNTAEVDSLREKVRLLQGNVAAKNKRIADLRIAVDELNGLVSDLGTQLAPQRTAAGSRTAAGPRTAAASRCTDPKHIRVNASVPLAGRVLLQLLAGQQDRGGPVNPVMQAFAVKLYSQSPAVYRYVRRTFGGNMPTEDKVMAWKKLADRLKQLK